MPGILWRGRLPLPLKVLVDANCLFASALGRTRDRAAMKRRVQLGYDGATCRLHLARYDETGFVHFTRTSEALLDAVEVRGRRVLDVGCGTGIASLLALDRGAVRVVGGDLAEGMLAVARAKAAAREIDPEKIGFRQLDAESLPFSDGSFDVVISGLMLQFATDPRRAVAEMARVLAPGGWIAVTTHGPEYYWEAIEAAFRSVGKRRLLGYRPEVWQSTEGELEALLAVEGLREVQCRRMTWQEEFASPDQAFDFFFATSSGFFLDVFPQAERERQLARIRTCFARRRVTEITSDIILGAGRRPLVSPGLQEAKAAATKKARGS